MLNYFSLFVKYFLFSLKSLFIFSIFLRLSLRLRFIMLLILNFSSSVVVVVRLYKTLKFVRKLLLVVSSFFCFILRSLISFGHLKYPEVDLSIVNTISSLYPILSLFLYFSKIVTDFWRVSTPLYVRRAMYLELPGLSKLGFFWNGSVSYQCESFWFLFVSENFRCLLKKECMLKKQKKMSKNKFHIK